MTEQNQTTDADDIQAAIVLSEKIDRKTDEALYPLMQAMRSWPKAYQAIMWRTVASKATREAEEVEGVRRKR